MKPTGPPIAAKTHIEIILGIENLKNSLNLSRPSIIPHAPIRDPINPNVLEIGWRTFRNKV